MNPKKVIARRVREISEIVGDGIAINALSGGVDSSVVTVLGYKAIGNQLKTYFVNNGLMRRGEAQQVVSVFKEIGIRVEVIDAQKEFFDALRGIIDPEEKREAITQTFYNMVFSKLVWQTGAKFLLQGTILTDVEETVAGIKRQHNVLKQIGINPQQSFGYKIIEPLVELRKDGVREIAKAFALPESVYNRMPFPGPALATRVIGEVTPKKVKIIRQATSIVERELEHTGAFQYLAILHDDRVTGMRDGKRAYGLQVEVRCWDSVDARTATPTKLSREMRQKLAQKITRKIPEVVSVVFNETPKPPSTIEAI